MVLVESAIAGIVAAFASQGVKNIEAKKANNGDVLITSGNQRLARLEKTITRLEPYDFMQALLDRVVSNKTNKQQDPDIIFENPLDKDVVITNISFIADVNFKGKGKALVWVNEATLILIDAADLSDVENLNIPIPDNGLTLRRGEAIKIWIWNGIDGTNVAMTALAVVGGYRR